MDDTIASSDQGNEKAARNSVTGLILGAAAVLGVTGDLLLRATPFGLNILLWAILLVVAVRLIRWRRVLPLDGNFWWVAVPVIGFALGMAWRDSPVLKTLDFLGLLLALGLAAGVQNSASVYLMTILQAFARVFRSVVAAAFGSALLILKDLDWKAQSSGVISARTWSLAKGLILSLPLLIIFGALLGSADAVFGKMIANVLNFDIAEALGHLFLAGFFAWMAGGYLRGPLFIRGTDATPLERPDFLRFGFPEVALPLFLLDVLFLGFVVVQFAYFFGGRAHLESYGLTYSEYARRGFFELVFVSALSLAILLLADWMLKADSPRSLRVFRVLAAIQIALLFVIMFSALKRMRLYQEQYGLTELRLYTTAFMFWLGAVFVWFIATVLAGKRQRFAFGALAAAAALVFGLHVLNPDAFIVKTNAAAVASGHEFDVWYAQSLSADSVPSLVQLAEWSSRLPPSDRQNLASAILRAFPPETLTGWRSWSWSRSRAYSAVSSHHSLLVESTRTMQMDRTSLGR